MRMNRKILTKCYKINSKGNMGKIDRILVEITWLLLMTINNLESMKEISYTRNERIQNWVIDKACDLPGLPWPTICYSQLLSHCHTRLG